MLGRAWRFLRRNKGKILLLGSAACASYYAYRHYIAPRDTEPDSGDEWEERQRILRDQERQKQECLESIKLIHKQEFFEIMLTNSNATAAEFLHQMRSQIFALDNLDSIRDMLKQLTTTPNNDPSASPVESSSMNIADLWQRLKVASLSRLVTVMYFSACSLLIFRVQWAVLTASLYLQQSCAMSLASSRSMTGITSGQNTIQHHLPEKVKAAYATVAAKVLQKLLPPLYAAVQQRCEEVLSKYSLKEALSLKQLDHMMHLIRRPLLESQLVNLLASVFTSSELSLTADLNSDMEEASCSDANAHFQRLVKETREIMQGNDVKGVFAACCDVLFISLQESFAEILLRPIKASVVNEKTPGRTTTNVPANERNVVLVKLLPHLPSIADQMCCDPKISRSPSAAVPSHPLGEEFAYSGVLSSLMHCPMLHTFTMNVFDSFCTSPIPF